MTYKLLTPLQIPDIADDGITPPEGFVKLYTNENKLLVKFSDGVITELYSLGTLRKRDVIVSEDMPDNLQGADGDIWLKYF